MRDHQFARAAYSSDTAELRIVGQLLDLGQYVIKLAGRRQRRVDTDVLDRFFAVDLRLRRPNDTHGQRLTERAAAAAKSRSRWRRPFSTTCA